MNLLNNKDLGDISFSAPSYGPDDYGKLKGSSRKDNPDDNLPGEWSKGYGSFSGVTDPELYSNALSDVAGVKSRLQGYSADGNNTERPGNSFMNTFRNMIDPKPTPERRLRQYAQSDAALEDALGGSFAQDMKQRLDNNRRASQETVNEEYVRNASVVGSNPENAFFRSFKTDNPITDVEKTIAETDIEKLEERLAPIVRHGGYDMEKYINERAVPAMYDKLIDELIEEEVPKSSAEYVFRSALGNSLIGKTSILADDLLNGGAANARLQDEALKRYNPGFFEDVFAGAGSLLVDAPVFSTVGSLAANFMGKVSGVLTSRLTNKILASKLGEGMTAATAKNLAQRLITRKLGHKILMSSGTQGITLGSYDALNSVADDLLYQNDVNLGKTAESFGKGLLTGAVLGVVGTPLRESAKGLTGVRKALASSGVLCAESAVFTAGTGIEKIRQGIDIAPVDLMKDFAKSTATLLVMRMAHWRPAGADIKLDTNGKLKEGFRLSNSEQAELKELNVNPEQFIEAVETELKLPSFGGERARFIKDAYTRLMTSDRLSAAAKSKLMFLVENKVTSTPPVAFDFTADKREDGKWRVVTYDAAGRVVSSNLFDHAGNAKSYFMVKRGEIRRNRIVLFETELTEGLRSENFLRQAGLYAKEKNKNIDEIAEAIYKKSTGSDLTFHERVIVDEILQRASYEESGMVQMLYDVRRKIEKRHGLEEGSMLLSVNEPFYKLNEAQNAALDEYEKVVRDEVDRLKQGTDRRRSVRLLKQGLGSGYFGMSNDEVKIREIEDYYRWVAERDADRIGLHSAPRPPAPQRPINIPPEDNSGYVWSYGAAKNTKEDIAAYRKRADELAQKYKVKLNYITDEREIERPDPEDYRAVMEYNNRILSNGWMHKGQVVINLPNAKNVQELERTVLHEVVAHKGLMHVFGEHLYDFMEDVFRKASPEVLRGISRTKYRYKGADSYEVVEEYLAYLAENVKLEPAERSLYVKVKDYIKSLLIRMKLYTGSNRQVSEAELTRIMQRHSEYLQKGAAPQDYMKDVFGDFRSAHFNDGLYYDHEGFVNSIKSRIDEGKLLSSIPKFFRDSKEVMYYDHLPPEQQKQIRERYGIVEDKAQEPAGDAMYRGGINTSLDGKHGADSGNSSSKGLLQENSGHLNRYPLAAHEDAANIQREMPDVKYNGLKDVDADGVPLPDSYPYGGTRYRLPDETIGKEPRYGSTDDAHKEHGKEERPSLERYALERGMAYDPTEGVPVLEDPFYRSLKANSPTYSYVYEHLRKLPQKEWSKYDYDLWNTLVDMSEGGAVQYVLKDIVTDRKFLDDYPELAMVPVSISKDLPMPVMYDKEKNRILLDRRVYLYPQSKFYIDGALRSVARDFEERRSSVARQVDEFNTRFTKNYEDAVSFARKIATMREFIPGFDADNGISETFRNEYGFMPDEFLTRFPNMDDYLLYKVTRGMSGLIDEKNTPEQRREKEKMLGKKISRHRKFFWGPVEIIMDAAGSGEGKGPLRVATAKDHANDELPRSGLDHSESSAMFMKYFPGVFRYFGIPDPTIKHDPTGWEEYKRIRNARKNAERERLGLNEKKRKAEEEERERERRRLEMN